MNEREASEELRKRLIDKKANTWDYMRLLSRYTQEQIRTCGYKSVEEALVKIMKDSDREIEKMIQEFEAKYPG